MPSLRHLLLPLFILSSYLPTLADTTQPNILVIFTDDQRADTIGALGNPHIHTPNLDKLAKRSFIFNNAYCYGAHTGAVCIASRNQLMTGNTWHRWAPKRYCLASTENLPTVMKKAGYQTFYREKSGKANHPQILKQFDDYADIHNEKALHSGRACKPFVDAAIDFLDNKRDNAKPFLMYLGVAGPHDPRFAEKRFRDLYDPSTLPIPKNYKSIHHWDIGSMTIRDECLESWPRTEEAVRSHIHDYYALVSAMDHDLGRLLDHLDSKQLTKDTIIIFTSDHGLAIGSHGLMGKQNIHEDGMKVPFMVAGPGVSPALIYIHDILPTIADFSRVDLKEKHDGVSLKPLIDGNSSNQRQFLTLAYQDSQRSIRDARWKLMVFPQVNKVQLFDLKSDPGETKNLASSKPEVVDRLMTQLPLKQKELSDNQALTVENPKPSKFEIPRKAKVKPRHLVGGQSKSNSK